MTQDPTLHDDELEAEIRLVGELVLAASRSDEHLSDEAIDAVLGLAPGPNGSTGGSTGSSTRGDDAGSGASPASGGGSPAGGEQG